MDADELAFAGAARHAQMVADGAVTSRQLTELFLDRIERLDPQLNAFRVVLAERALAEADQADARRKGGDTRPLLGVPVAIKDDTDVAGESTCWGGAAHAGPVARDAAVVARLRTAGAVILGKTSVPEMTLWPFTETLTFGVTRNPWNLERTPGGSSGGSAAAVAAGLCAMALGTDGAGSIRIPGAWCGLFGIKPQRDRIPLAPHDDAWLGLSVNGPLTRTVADAALFLDATADDIPEGGFLAAARTTPGPLRIACSTKLIPGQLARISSDVRGALKDTIELLRALGHEVVQRDPDYPRSAFGHVLVRYLRGASNDVATLPHPERLERRTRTMAWMGGRISDARVAGVRAQEAALRAQVNEAWSDCDVLLQPGPVAGPFKVGAFQGRSAPRTLNAVARRVPFQALWNVTGQPSMVVPSGRDRDGLPIGLQFTGRPHDEATLLSLAAQIEQRRPWADDRPPLS